MIKCEKCEKQLLGHPEYQVHLKVVHNDGKTAIYLDNEEMEQFKSFRKHQSQVEAITTSWKQVMDFTQQMGSGSFSLTVQNGLPVRINNPMQTLIISMKI